MSSFESATRTLQGGPFKVLVTAASVTGLVALLSYFGYASESNALRLAGLPPLDMEPQAMLEQGARVLVESLTLDVLPLLGLLLGVVLISLFLLARHCDLAKLADHPRQAKAPRWRRVVHPLCERVQHRAVLVIAQVLLILLSMWSAASMLTILPSSAELPLSEGQGHLAEVRTSEDWTPRAEQVARWNALLCPRSWTCPFAELDVVALTEASSSGAEAGGRKQGVPLRPEDVQAFAERRYQWMVVRTLLCLYLGFVLLHLAKEENRKNASGRPVPVQVLELARRGRRVELQLADSDANLDVDECEPPEQHTEMGGHDLLQRYIAGPLLMLAMFVQITLLPAAHGSLAVSHVGREPVEVRLRQFSEDKFCAPYPAPWHKTPTKDAPWRKTLTKDAPWPKTPTEDAHWAGDELTLDVCPRPDKSEPSAAFNQARDRFSEAYRDYFHQEEVELGSETMRKGVEAAFARVLRAARETRCVSEYVRVRAILPVPEAYAAAPALHDTLWRQWGDELALHSQLQFGHLLAYPRNGQQHLMLFQRSKTSEGDAATWRASLVEIPRRCVAELRMDYQSQEDKTEQQLKALTADPGSDLISDLLLINTPSALAGLMRLQCQASVSEHRQGVIITRLGTLARMFRFGEPALTEDALNLLAGQLALGVMDAERLQHGPVATTISKASAEADPTDSAAQTERKLQRDRLDEVCERYGVQRWQERPNSLEHASAAATALHLSQSPYAGVLLAEILVRGPVSKLAPEPLLASPERRKRVETLYASVKTSVTAAGFAAQYIGNAWRQAGLPPPQLGEGPESQAAVFLPAEGSDPQMAQARLWRAWDLLDQFMAVSLRAHNPDKPDQAYESDVRGASCTALSLSQSPRLAGLVPGLAKQDPGLLLNCAQRLAYLPTTVAEQARAIVLGEGEIRLRLQALIALAEKASSFAASIWPEVIQIEQQQIAQVARDLTKSLPSEELVESLLACAEAKSAETKSAEAKPRTPAGRARCLARLAHVDDDYDGGERMMRRLTDVQGNTGEEQLVRDAACAAAQAYVERDSKLARHAPKPESGCEIKGLSDDIFTNLPRSGSGETSAITDSETNSGSRADLLASIALLRGLNSDDKAEQANALRAAEDALRAPWRAGPGLAGVALSGLLQNQPGAARQELIRDAFLYADRVTLVLSVANFIEDLPEGLVTAPLFDCQRKQLSRCLWALALLKQDQLAALTETPAAQKRWSQWLGSQAAVLGQLPCAARAALAGMQGLPLPKGCAALPSDADRRRKVLVLALAEQLQREAKDEADRAGLKKIEEALQEDLADSANSI